MTAGHAFDPPTAPAVDGATIPPTDAASPPTDGASPPMSGRRRRLGTTLKIVFGVAVLVFGVYFFASHWTQIRIQLGHADWRWLIAAVVFAGVGLSSSAFSLRSLLQLTSRHRLPAPAAARLFFVSQLGKYLPGSIWPVVAVAQMGRKHGIDADASATAGILALFISLMTGGAFGIVITLVGSAGGGGAGVWWLLLLLPVMLILAMPSLVFKVVNLGLKLLRRNPIELTPDSRSHYFAACGFSVVSWTLLGLQCWALCVSLGADPMRSLLVAVGGFALAYTAGTLVVPVPAGGGVREAVLGFVLSATLVGTDGFDKVAVTAIVLAVVLLSRVVLAVLDFSFAGASMLVYRFSTREQGNGTPAVVEPDRHPPLNPQ